MVGEDKPQGKVAYKVNVRLPPPKTRFGWLGGFFYRFKKNRDLHIARLYGIGGLAGIFMAAIGFKKYYDVMHAEKQLADRYDVAKLTDSLTPEEIEEHEKKMANSFGADKIVNPSGRPDFIMFGGGTLNPEIKVSERGDFIEATIQVPILGNATLKSSLDKIAFDDDGIPICDESGFPVLKDQTERPISISTWIRSKYRSWTSTP